MLPPTLTTERLELRALRLDDAPIIETLAGDRMIAATTRLPHPYPPGLGRAFIERQGASGNEGEHNWAMVRRSDGTFLGVLGFIRTHPGPMGELGYWVGRPYWGQGYTSEAVRAVCEHGFRNLGLTRIFAEALGTTCPRRRYSKRTASVLKGCCADTASAGAACTTCTSSASSRAVARGLSVPS
ncbi:MAG: GNAT family N-acetyltransferase [Planctomycetota bacterium]